MKYILCSEYQKESIYHELLEKTNGELGTKLFTLSNLLDDGEEIKEETAFHVRKKLLEKKDVFTCYSKMFDYPDFIDEILSFARDLILWNIPVSSLPQDTNQEIELKEILSLVLKENLKEKNIIRSCSEKLKNIDTYGEVQMFPQFEKDYFRYTFLKEIEKKANIKKVSYKETHTTHERRYALSSRQELEAIAQDICIKQKPCNIILCNYSEEYPVLKQVFSRYNIPFYAIKDDAFVNIPYIFVSLANLALKKDNTSFVTALKYNSFAVHTNSTVIDYFYFHPDEFQSFIEEKKLPLFSHDEKKINHVIEQCNAFLSKIQDDLFYLLESDSAKEALERAYTVLSSSPYLKNPLELKAGIQIHKVLSALLDSITDDKDAEFLTRQVLIPSVSCSTSYSSFCTVTDLTHPVKAKEISYIANCSGRNYPGVPVKKGLFDEDYVSKIEGYPLLSDRHHAYLEELEWIHSSAKHVIYSYPTNDYQGREIQLSFEIKQKDTSETRWNVTGNTMREKTKHALDASLAQKLFLNEDKQIVGSISSIERYFNCPFSYFIASGLKVLEDTYTENNSAFIGTVSHSVMENACKTHSKKYPGIEDEQIKQILHPYFEQLTILHPKDAALHTLTEERLFHSLKVSFTYLQDEENNTLFKPVQEEKRFTSTIFPGIYLRGIIDRIDEVNGMFRIIDYKSSEHSLSIASIKAGLQLQLLTYLLVEANSNSKKPAGMYYINLQTTNTPLPASSGYKVKTGITLNEMCEDTYKNAMYKTKTLKGWNLCDTANEYTDYCDFYSPGKKTYSLEQIRSGIYELYDYFYKAITEGKIQLDPLEGACTFCKYKSICRFTGILKKAEPILDKDFTFDGQKETEEE